MMSKLRPTKRASAAIGAVVAAAIGGYVSLFPGAAPVPDDVALAVKYLVQPWESRQLRAYPDPATGGAPWTICDGDTKGVRRGMVETPAGCDKRTARRIMEFRAALVACIPNFERAPLAWRAMMDSLAWNIGDGLGANRGGVCNSTAAALGHQGRWVESCNAATRYNRAAGKVMRGLVLRREMGDATRIGEGELCVTGLK
jgi:GH24 family phage-related lysozyme (muramidase)